MSEYSLKNKCLIQNIVYQAKVRGNNVLKRVFIGLKKNGTIIAKLLQGMNATLIIQNCLSTSGNIQKSMGKNQRLGDQI